MKVTFDRARYIRFVTRSRLWRFCSVRSSLRKTSASAFRLHANLIEVWRRTCTPDQWWHADFYIVIFVILTIVVTLVYTLWGTSWKKFPTDCRQKIYQIASCTKEINYNNIIFFVSSWAEGKARSRSFGEGAKHEVFASRSKTDERSLRSEEGIY